MDKRKLYRDIAQIRKQIFSITCLITFVFVSIGTYIGHGLDFFRMFQNTILSIILIGGLAYLLGILYQWIVEAPLIESYREDAQKRIDELKSSGGQRLAMPLSVSELSPGMKIIDAIHNNDGALLVRAGAVLTERLINTLKDNNIASVKVEAQRNIPNNNDIE